MGRFSAYILCGTPRSGSTLLCKMLSATGVAGRPHSYFRKEDLQEWAEYWGVPVSDDIDSPDFDRAYLAAMIRAGRAGTDIFGLRLMWASVVEATKRLNHALAVDQDIARSIDAAFGPTFYIYVSRNDKIAQAISRVRAEQSGLWHLTADGAVLEGAEILRPVSYDGARIAELIQELQQDDASWNAFFRERGIVPLKLVYEAVIANPNGALQTIVEALGLDVEVARKIPVPTAKIANKESDLWIERFRQEQTPKQ